MSGTTTNAGIRYPLPGDPPVGDRDVERLAFDIDAALTTLDTARTFATHRPRASIRQVSSTTSVSKGTLTTVTNFDQADYDNAGMWNASARDRLTVQSPGVYIATAHGALATPTPPNPASGACSQIEILVAGSPKVHKKQWITNDTEQDIMTFGFLLLAAGQAVTFRWFWNGTNPAGPLTASSAHLSLALFRTNP